MLLYVEGSAFLGRTFVLMCNEEDTVARIKAKLLHPLHDWGKATFQFRLRYKSRYLQDTATLESQHVVENAVVEMVPLTRTTDPGTVHCRNVPDDGRKELQDTRVLQALQREVKLLERRSLLMQALKVTMYLQLLAVPLLFASVYWWSGFWSGLFALYTFFYLPAFYYVGGVATVPNVLHFRFIVVNSILCFLTAGAATALFVVLLLSSAKLLDGCQSANNGQVVSLASDSCSSQVWFSAIIHPLQGLVNLAAMLTSILLGINLRFKIGDQLEGALLQLRDIAQVLSIARSEDSSVQEKRDAAAQINGFVATSDDAKFQVVEMEGLLSLINLSLTKDEATQVLAAEALAIMLEVPAIQNEFVAENGLPSVCALLRSPNTAVQGHACRALALVVTDNPDSAAALAEGTGLSDISFILSKQLPAQSSSSDSMSTEQSIADILAHLITQPVVAEAIRHHQELFDAIVARCEGAPAKAVSEADYREEEEAVSERSDKINGRLTSVCLECLRRLALETPSLLEGKTELLHSLLAMPSRTSKQRGLPVLIPTAKLLLCFADDDSLSTMLPLQDLRDTLGLLVSTHNAQLLHLTLEIVQRLTENHREALLRHDYESLASEILAVVKRQTHTQQDQATAEALMADVDTRSEHDKLLGTVENMGTVDEEEEEDTADAGEAHDEPGSIAALSSAAPADIYPDLCRLAQQLSSSLSLNSTHRKPLIAGRPPGFQRQASRLSLLSASRVQK